MATTATDTLLSDSFHADVAACNGTPADAARWYDRLIQHYTEPQRHYHTTTHLTAMLHCATQHNPAIPDPLTLRLAIYFHDIVYNPQRHDNEAESVRLFNVFAVDVGLDTVIATQVRHYIDCTVSHTVPVESVENVSLCYFLDFDLEVLSRSEEAYDVYAAQIALEYAHVSRDAYHSGRSAVLQKFLQRDRLYFTEAFREAHEAQARRNLVREIAALSSAT